MNPHTFPMSMKLTTKSLKYLSFNSWKYHQNTWVMANESQKLGAFICAGMFHWYSSVYCTRYWAGLLMKWFYIYRITPNSRAGRGNMSLDGAANRYLLMCTLPFTFYGCLGWLRYNAYQLLPSVIEHASNFSFCFHILPYSRGSEYRNNIGHHLRHQKLNVSMINTDFTLTI